MPTSAHIQFYVDGDGATGDGATGDDLDHDGDGAAYDNIDDDCDGVTGDEVDNDGNGVKLSLPSMRRHLCRRSDGVVALVVMASLPLLMRRRLAVVDNDGDGATGDEVDDGDDSFALPLSRWHCCPLAMVSLSCRCAGILPLSTMMVMA